MRRLITIAIGTAWLVAPAIDGTSDARDTSDQPQCPAENRRASGCPSGMAANKREDEMKGLSRNLEDCNKGCTGGNAP